MMLYKIIALTIHTASIKSIHHQKNTGSSPKRMVKKLPEKRKELLVVYKCSLVISNDE